MEINVLKLALFKAYSGLINVTQYTDNSERHRSTGMGKLQTHITLILISLPLVAWSAEHVEKEMPQAQFSFQHQSFAVGSQVQDERFRRDGQVINSGRSMMQGDDLFGQLNQYDATFSYPFHSNKNLNFDLGVNLRFIDGDLIQNGLEPSQVRFNTAMPMLYANALYSLPNSGLSASIGASHFEYDQYYALDYKAKLSYQWEAGFGLEGGWQHQQLTIDGPDIQAEIQNTGPFLDFNYRF